MQQTTGVAVLATELPATDRRALSQAWYSALHLTERAPRARSTLPTGSAGAPAGDGPGARAAHTGARHSGPSTPERSHDVRARHDGGMRRAALTSEQRASEQRTSQRCAPERRAAKSELARLIERALADRSRGAPASFAVAAAGGRVRILVRSDGARTRLVAVCAPPLRERVERALAQARFALAARGVRAEVA